YDGLIESLGGAHTPAVGWAAGIERLAMLVGKEPYSPEKLLKVIIAVEDDSALNFATAVLAALRRDGLSADMIATGSPKKRYDKAAKINAHALMSVTMKDGQPNATVRSAQQSVIISEIERIIGPL